MTKKTMKCIGGALLGVLVLSQNLFAADAPLRPPAVPLVTHDP